MPIALIPWGLLTVPAILGLLGQEHHALVNMNSCSLLQMSYCWIWLCIKRSLNITH